MTSIPATRGELSQLLDRGVYALTLLFNHDEMISEGSMGRLPFRKGSYVYIGSARTNLRQRVARHVATTKRVRWHIDYLTVRREVTPIAVAAWRLRAECEVATILKKASEGSVPHFGSSDCHCGSHLVYFVSSARRIEAISAIAPEVCLPLVSVTRRV